MKTTADFLDALRAKLNLPSDGQLADYFGMHRQYMSRYRRNNCTFDDEMSMKVADILEIDQAYVVASMHYQRAKQPAVKAMWKHTAEVLFGIAAMVGIMSVLPMQKVEWDGFNAALLGITVPDLAGTLYIMSNVGLSYWWVLIPLTITALYLRPRKISR